jgi:hypothetical protein
MSEDLLESFESTFDQYNQKTEYMNYLREVQNIYSAFELQWNCSSALTGYLKDI